MYTCLCINCISISKKYLLFDNSGPNAARIWSFSGKIAIFNGENLVKKWKTHSNEANKQVFGMLVVLPRKGYLVTWLLGYLHRGAAGTKWSMEAVRIISIH